MIGFEYGNALSRKLIEVFGKNTFSKEELTKEFFLKLFITYEDFFRTVDGRISLDLFWAEDFQEWIRLSKDENGVILCTDCEVTAVDSPEEYTDYDVEEDELYDQPGESLCFQRMCSALHSGLTAFILAHPCGILNSFQTALFSDLERFAKGDEIKSYDFDICVRPGDSMVYVSFHIEVDMIQISKGGSVYTPTIGSDSYTDWDYYIWRSGREDPWRVDLCSFDIVTELFCDPGAVFSIEFPDEFCYSSDSRYS